MKIYFNSKTKYRSQITDHKPPTTDNRQRTTDKTRNKHNEKAKTGNEKLNNDKRETRKIMSDETKRNDLRIIFMGTPDFAVASLKAMVEAGYNIVGVITAPDKPAGRGMKLTASAVKKYAAENGLRILQPEKLKNADFLNELRSLNADLQIVVAFRMLPEIVWNMPRLGTINVHGSVLPQYRGAAPINWAVINGERETGVTTFKLQQEIDTGNILLKETFAIDENETAGDVHDRMKDIGAQLLLRTIEGLKDGSLQEVEQMVFVEKTSLKHAPKIFTETCIIDWSKTVEEVHNLIRGLSPYPGAIATLQGKMLKIYKSEKEPFANEEKGQQKTGATFETDGKNYLKFVCANGFIHAKEVQLEGKKRISIEDFLRGYRF